MSFQAYIDNIQAKTGKNQVDFKAMAADKGFATEGTLTPGTKTGDIIAWLKQDFDVGHSHAMAIVALLKGKEK